MLTVVFMLIFFIWNYYLHFVCFLINDLTSLLFYIRKSNVIRKGKKKTQNDINLFFFKILSQVFIFKGYSGFLLKTKQKKISICQLII